MTYKEYRACIGGITVLVDDAVKLFQETYQHEPWFIAVGSGTVAGAEVIFVYVRTIPRHAPDTWYKYPLILRRSGTPRAAL